jgi:hypothetical protein
MKRICGLIPMMAIVGCSGAVDEFAALRVNIGKVACNATNGMYVGPIVDVRMYSAAGQAASPVYVVERDGRLINRQPENTVVVAERCSDGQPTVPVQKTSAPRAVTDSGTVDSELANVEVEFKRRLLPYQGNLRELSESSGIITVKWTSQRCDMTEGEVIDFLLSLIRHHRTKISGSIRAQRTCESSTRAFETTGKIFEQYRDGQVNDAEILRSLQ